MPGQVKICVFAQTVKDGAIDSSIIDLHEFFRLIPVPANK